MGGGGWARRPPHPVYGISEGKPLPQVRYTFSGWLDAAIEDEVGIVQGDNFIIMRDRTDWFSEYTKRIDAGVVEAEKPGVTYQSK